MSKYRLYGGVTSIVTLIVEAPDEETAMDIFEVEARMLESFEEPETEVFEIERLEEED